MKKNILFIGDLRLANNYGAIATTETLDKLIHQNIKNINIKYIDYKSFYSPTPINGWSEKFNHNHNYLKQLKKIIKYVIPSCIIEIIKKQNNIKKKEYVPY